MKSKPILFWFFGTLGLVLCVLVARLEYLYFFGPNARRYNNGPVHADGDIDVFGRGSFDELRIGNSESPYQGQFAFDIQIADGTVFSFPGADITSIVAKADSTRDPNRNYDLWPKDAVDYTLGDSSILITGGQINRIYFYPNSQTAIRRGDSTTWLHLPLSDEDLTTLFGPAQRIIETRRR